MTIYHKITILFTYGNRTTVKKEFETRNLEKFNEKMFTFDNHTFKFPNFNSLKYRETKSKMATHRHYLIIYHLEKLFQTEMVVIN